MRFLVGDRRARQARKRRRLRLVPRARSLPPVGAALSIVFLFVLAQALRHERLLDPYEMLARLLVATAVAFLIALIFYLLLTFIGGFNTMYLNAVLAAIVILVLFDPLRERVEEQLQRLFLRERFDLDRSLAEARRRLVHTLEVDEMGSMVMSALEQSRRVTGAALYLRDQDGTGFDRLASLGPRVPERIEVATASALLDRARPGAARAGGAGARGPRATGAPQPERRGRRRQLRAADGGAAPGPRGRGARGGRGARQPLLGRGAVRARRAGRADRAPGRGGHARARRVLARGG